MESAAPCPRAHAHPVDLRWLLSVAAGGLFALLLVLLATSPSFRLASTSPSPRLFLGPASGSSRARPPLFVEPALSRPAAPSPPASASLPRFAYLISGSAGDAGMMRRCLLALYHPRNRYVLHLDAEAPDADRAGLAAFVAAHPVLAAARNVRVVEKANLVTYRGPTMVTTTLHAAAALLWGEGRGRGADWDWFINLSASDYPLVTQDDLMHVFSKLPRDLNFIDHTSNISWKAFARAMPVIIDPALYMKKKGDLFWVPERRSLPTAFKLFTGSAWMVLSRAFVEYLIWGWDNLPRTVLMYYANFISSPEGYFHTVACNADGFRNTTVNSDLHFISWDNPPMQHPHQLTVGDWDRMLGSGAPFARKFRRDDPVLDRIDADILARGPGTVAPGGWCGRGAAGGGGQGQSNGTDPCAAVGDAAVLRPGPGAERLQRLVTSLLSEENFRPRQCVVENEN
ncbi:Beta-glucuronosyltransferase GlcAT14A [Zea mays]|uniref:BGGP Beta-1-3-galactosyl-O-glycosyl-glycoprotein n=1 Tax=Zea mays TaxID=4577 RepID=B6SUI5_MAIZE|nr:Beta-glucuronosyltransferase GlcAT14A [Zea mays]ACG28518.1 BGGP Beta-1-3-galactosyl-O-glycosyl-glycoprotein [Zea mays]|eukprot:NP_001147735.1 BGGP Beta-1-3-galactosyl-O-glycosyl-glycoprotein [Zea mays]